jgi:hypothetical protein
MKLSRWKYLEMRALAKGCVESKNHGKNMGLGKY